VLGGSTWGKKVNGRKRLVAVDMLGLVWALKVVPASTQDRVGGFALSLEVARSRQVHQDAIGRAALRYRLELRLAPLEVGGRGCQKAGCPGRLRRPAGCARTTSRLSPAGVHSSQ
jgi:hypothetical protein